MRYEYIRKPRKCPVCGSSCIVNTLYGLREFSPKLENDLNAGRIKFGGCCISDNDPKWHCAQCEIKIYLKSQYSKMNINDYLTEFMNGRGESGGRQSGERYASFDYCFNYFQEFREDKALPDIANEANIELSCLHLSFYLASWGMFRGSSFLLEKSSKFFEPVIQTISSTNESVWDIDVDKYSDDNITLLIECAKSIANTFGKTNNPTDTLITKIMLGVFGNVPAFDGNFRKGFDCHSFGKKNLKMIKKIYEEHKDQIDSKVIYTLDFTGTETKRQYTKAKIIDMIGFIKGQET